MRRWVRTRKERKEIRRQQTRKGCRDRETSRRHVTPLCHMINADDSCSSFGLQNNQKTEKNVQELDVPTAENTRHVTAMFPFEFLPENLCHMSRPPRRPVSVLCNTVQTRRCFPEPPANQPFTEIRRKKEKQKKFCFYFLTEIFFFFFFPAQLHMQCFIMSPKWLCSS